MSPPLPLKLKFLFFGFFRFPSSSVHVMTHVHVSGCMCMLIFMFSTCHAIWLFDMSLLSGISCPPHVTYVISTCFRKTSVTTLFTMLLHVYPCMCCHVNVIFHVFHVFCHQ